MKYMLLIHEAESRFAAMNEQEVGELMAAYDAFGKELDAAGARLAADRLQATSTATTVRVRNGETLTTDVQT